MQSMHVCIQVALISYFLAKQDMLVNIYLQRFDVLIIFTMNSYLQRFIMALTPELMFTILLKLAINKLYYSYYYFKWF